MNVYKPQDSKITLTQQQTYWQQQLGGDMPVLEIPLDYPRSPQQSFIRAKEAVKLDEKLCLELNQFCLSENVTLFTTLLAAFKVLLLRYTGQKDIIVGSLSADSLQEKEEANPERFINPVVLRTNLTEELTARELCKRVGNKVEEAAQNRDYPFEKLVAAVNGEQNLTRAPIFQVMLVLCDVPFCLSQTPICEENLASQEHSALCDLVVLASQKEGNLIIIGEYNADLFGSASIRRMLGHLQTLLENFILNPDQCISTLPLLTEAERHQLLVEWNDTKTDFPQDKCIHELFEEQVNKTPLSLAVVFDNQQLTYFELNQRANQLAHYLQTLGVQPEVLVGVCMERSVEMVVGILAVLKAGGAYVPLDPDYPTGRLQFMLEDTQIRVLLTQQQLVESVPKHQAHVVCLDTDWEKIAQNSHSILENTATPDNLAYVIYTSGSTGKPKGVLVSHCNVVRLFAATNCWYNFNSQDVWTLFHSYAFDFSVWEIWGALLYGGRLVVVPYLVTRSPNSFLELLCQEKVTILNQTPSAFRQLIQAEQSIATASDLNLRLVIFGGEALELKSLQPWFDRYGDELPQLVNMYGITETTVHVTYRPLSKADLNTTASVIGRPIPDLQVYVLDEHLQPVPIGVAGEMYVGGAGVAYGYLNREELTAQRFISNSFSNNPQARLYKTGDKARYLPNGELEYLGRIDNQVKIRGFRIELGEIESLLGQHPAVQQNVVVVRSDDPDQKRLVAYVVLNSRSEDFVDKHQTVLESDQELVSQWEKVYDQTYSQTTQSQDPTFNIVGWNSSYTDLPIPEAQMREWVDRTVERILTCQPKRVLEIGCGTGLLLFRIAPHCTKYYGTDISQTALNYIQEQISRLEQEIPQVTLAQKTADNFEGIEPKAFDAVIVNSVLQLFPDINYLLKVIEGAVNTLTPGGFIFLGDIRSFPLIKAFHASVQLERSPASLSVEQLRQRVQREISQDKELLIDPTFFTALQQHLPKISHVQIQIKRGRCHNELTKFRYDVILYIEKEVCPTLEVRWLDWQKDKLSMPIVRQILTETEPEILGIKHVPNARLSAEIKLLNLLSCDEGSATVGELRENLQSFSGNGVEPEDWWVLSDELPYTIYINWSEAGALGCYDIVFQQSKTSSPVLSNSVSNDQVKPWTAYANNPLQGQVAGKLRSVLRSYLKERLPDYMVPAAFVVLDKMPLTPNGKVDRRVLPAPEMSRPELSTNLVMPQSDAEQLIAKVWREVLQLEVVGIHDNFFDLGGHSLLLLQVRNKLVEIVGSEVSIIALFQHLTIHTLAQHLSQNKPEVSTVKHNNTGLRLLPVSRTRELPLSFAQERMWFLSQLEPTNPFYNEPQTLRFHGSLNIVALEKSLNKIIQRHEALRTNFVTVDWQPVQVITETLTLSVPVVDLQHLPESEREIQIQQLARAEAQQPFDLASSPLIRPKLLKLTQLEHVLVLTMHHIVFDGWSWGIILQELATVYSALSNDLSPELPELPIQYADFAVWQRQWLTKEALSSQLAYWKQQLSGMPDLLELPTDRVRPSTQTFRGAHHKVALSKELTQALVSLSQRSGVTLFMTLLAAFKTLLYRYTGMTDICVGTPHANRDRTEIEGLVGFFVNTLVLRTDMSGNPSFEDVLSRVREVTQEAYAHKDLPFAKLVEELQIKRDLSYTPLVQVMLAFHNVPMPEIQLEGLTASRLAVESATAKFDLLLSLENTASGLIGEWEYNTDLFDATTIEQMVGHFQTLLEAIVANPEQRVSELPLLTERERHQLLVEWNNTAQDYPQDKCIHQLFEEQVTLTPDAIAVVFEGEQLTYKELNQRANQLAHYLQRLGVGTEVLVGICVERSIEMVVGLLGILKAGGAYVPLDPTYPLERLRYMLENSSVRVLLTQQQLVESLADRQAHMVCLDIDWEIVARQSEGNPASGVTPENLTYVIYTSGSTGFPKGVAMSHRPLSNLILWQLENSTLPQGAKTLQFTPLCFDVSFQEIFSTWCAGGMLVLISEEVRRDPVQLLGFLKLKGIARLFLPFVALQQLALVADGSETVPTNLREVITAGEQLQITRQIADWFINLNNCTLHNQYGPSESHVVTAFTLTGSPSDWPALPPIGRPITNTQIYLLDAQLQPVPIGVYGDLYIGGIALARGYFNDTDLTISRFIPHPYSDKRGSRLYKTGDCARYLPDGNIEFLGRIDKQVKIRGFRIELGEIETAIALHPTVRETVVVAREDVPDRKYLAAYIVPNQSSAIATSDLRGFLKEKLPDYMIPGAFVILDVLPLTPNGKVDRRALPAPDFQHELQRSLVAPKTPIEEMLASIWTDVLGIELVGVHHNFFELGGHSLLATQVISRVRDTLAVELPLRSLFESPTVASLAKRVEIAIAPGQSIKVSPLLPISRAAEIPLSFAQQRLWFIEQLHPNSGFYNIPLALRLCGQLNVAALESSLNEIIRRHEALRTNFATIEGKPVQVIASTLNLKLQVVDLLHIMPSSDIEVETQRLATTEAMEPFDLEHSPLVRATLLQQSETEHVFVLTVHHIIFDGWSMGVLYSELATLYATFCADSTPVLVELSIQYADFSVWQRQWLTGEILSTQLNYWKQQLKDAPGLLELPTSRPRPAVQTNRGAYHSLALSQELSVALTRLSKRTGVTLFMTLLAAFQTLLFRYTGQDDIVVGTPIANRNRKEIEGLIGFFVNTLVMRTDLSGNPSFKQLLSRVREVAIGAYAHQDLPFEELVEALQPARSLSHTPLFQVMFTLENSPMPSFDLPDLTVSSLVVETTAAKFDLTLSMSNTSSGLIGTWEYNRDLFDNDTIARMAEHFQTLLSGIVANPEQHLTELPLLTEAEQHQLLVEWNNTTKEYPKDKCIHQLFEEQVTLTPDAIAVVFEGEQLTYKELNQRANQLAHHLQRLGVGLEVLVGICVERSIEMVVGLLGILKAGGAYVPLDPTYPLERLVFMLEDAQVPVLLTQAKLVESLPKHKARIVCLDTDWEVIAQQSQENLKTSVTPDKTIYVVYTSGSTGLPKGVPVPHLAVSRLVINTNYINIGSKDVIAQVSNSSFDAATFEIWGALLNGAKLVVITKDVALSPLDFTAAIKEQGITVLFLTTALFNLVAREVPCAFSEVQHLLFGGEAVDLRWVKKVLKNDPPVRLLHVYGPTESTTFTTWYLVQHVPEGAKNIPIGRPIANTHCFLLDDHLQPVPIGVPGELYVGGDGLARGYLNRPDLTNEKFIPNPISNDPRSRLYKTGDLARYLSDGNIEFLGRIDNQVKLRGFRIELGEIEVVLATHPQVQETTVIVREDIQSDKRLVAYIVPKTETELNSALPTVSEFRSFLKSKLPDYMVPNAFVILEAMPLTPNGKVDRRNLPVPDHTTRPDAAYVMPQTKVEQVVATVWQEMLHVEKVGIYDNFFELGGHSLLVVQVHHKLQEILGVKLSVVEMFQYPTIHSLSEHLSNYLNIQDASKQSNGHGLNLRDHQASMQQQRQLRQHHQSDIAIIAMSGQFPKAQDIDSLWNNLCNGIESISFFSEQEMVAEGVNIKWLNNPKHVRASGVLSDIELFDAYFFGYSPKEAELIDPQQRLFLECAWSAIEKAGYDPENYKGLIGVYAGCGGNDYLLKNLYPNRDILELNDFDDLSYGNAPDHLATRVSYKLNLTGPALNIQTACSTSLVAVHLGCQSLLNGECDMAIAGGVSIHLPQKTGYLYQEGLILSNDGHCRAFDAKAKGTVGGNGVGIVVLKRLADAIADGDYIHAVIKGSSINNDGSLKVGYTAPSVEGQATVISQAQAVAGIDPDTITYIEAHGTATPLGDPIEIAALTQAFRASTQNKSFCAIGSLKSNIGHLNTAAGVAGLIKTVLALKHKLLPPSLHFEQPSPQIDFANSPFYVNTKLSPWETNGTPRRAGVSSFGIGGTNAHVVLEETPAEFEYKSQESGESGRKFQLLVLSAKTERALDTATANLVEHLTHHPDINLADVAYTLEVGRKAFNYRRILVCSDTEDAVNTLSTQDPKRIFTNVQEHKNRPIAFMFSGQGSQYVNMALELYEEEPAFTEQINLCAELLKPHLGLDLRDVLYPSEELAEQAATQLKQTAIAQPALFTIEYALAKLWMSWGVHPKAAIGHSIGEYVAATLAGVFSLEEALSLVAARGQLTQQMPPGSMLAVPLPQQQVQPLLNNKLSLAAINESSLCTVSGATDAIEALQQQLQAQGVECRRLHTSHAFHSQMMEPILETFTEQVKKVNLKPPQIPYISNVSGTWITAEEATNPSYWARHLRQTVLFSSGLQTLLQQQDWVLLEVGPGRTLSAIAKKHDVDKAAEQVILSSLRHPQDQQSDVAFLLNALGRLWLAGIQVDWAGFYAGSQRHRLPLPTYPFERQRYWVEPPKEAGARKELNSHFHNAVPEWTSIVEAGRTQALSELPSFDNPTYHAKQQCLDLLCVANMNLALTDLGAFSNPSEKHSIEDLLSRFSILPEYEQLLSRWLKVLVEHGQLQQDGETFTNFVPISRKSWNALIEEVKVRWADTPLWAQTVLLSREKLAALLTGREKSRDVFFAKGSFDKAEAVAGDWPMLHYYNAIARASLQRVVKLLPPKVKLRILEIGAGMGLTTAELLPVLPLQQTSYTFTDVGRLFLDNAKQKFSAYPFLEYRLLNIEESPKAQGYEEHSFDMVVAANVLHVTRNMGETLEHVRSLLAPGGFLLVWEVTQPLLEFDITDGFLMKPLDDGERSQSNPFLSKEQWISALREHRFIEVAALPETEVLGFHILLAKASESANVSATTAFTVCPDDAIKTDVETLQAKSPKTDFSSLHSTRPNLPNPYVAPRNQIERTITEIWQKFFGIEQVGIYDDFFELGGDSLLAVHLISKLCEALKTELSSHSLISSSTIASLAELIEQTATASTVLNQPSQQALPELLVEIKSGSFKQPLFLIHPAGGQVYIYRDLARLLGLDYPVYGLQAQGIDGKKETLTQIEEMATKYIEALRVVQPDGPYFLGGASSGGTVAFEMAQQLLALGEQVALLALIDTPGPGQMPAKVEDDDLLLLAYLLNVGANFSFCPEDFQQMEPDERLVQFVEQVRHSMRLPPDYGLAELRFFLNLLKVDIQTMRNYTPRTYPGRVIFFRANERDATNPQNPELAWVNLAAGGLEVHEVPGNHITMNYAPNVQVIAERLRTYLLSLSAGGFSGLYST
jgi:amino acid adenylation domain-containing protein